jgi:hypothetical protein
MNIIKTTAPIAIDKLKEFFVNKENTSFLIDYENSQLQGSKLLIYLSNLDVPCDIDIDIFGDEYLNLLAEYMKSPFIVNIDTLEKGAIDVMQVANGTKTDTTSYDKFITENKEVVDYWLDVLNSLPAYNLYCVDVDEFKEFAKSRPVKEIDASKGINFVSLLKHEEFFNFYQNWNDQKSFYIDEYFNDYIFKGKNLYSFWANENNPMFLLTWGVSSGYMENYINTVEEYEESK